MRVFGDAISSTMVDKSGTVTSGGVAQVLMAANDARRGWRLQNTSDTDLWWSDVGTAAAGGSSHKLGAGDMYVEDTVVTTAAISVFGATTGKTFAAREW